MFPIRKQKFLIIAALVAALVSTPGAALAAQPGIDAGAWLEPLQQRLSLWISELVDYGDAAEEPDSIRQPLGCGADPDGAPCAITDLTLDSDPCDPGSGGACSSDRTP